MPALWRARMAWASEDGAREGSIMEEMRRQRQKARRAMSQANCQRLRDQPSIRAKRASRTYADKNGDDQPKRRCNDPSCPAVALTRAAAPPHRPGNVDSPSAPSRQLTAPHDNEHDVGDGENEVKAESKDGEAERGQ